jgi:hypothetical protein
MELRDGVEERERRAARAGVQPVRDAAVERDERAARGDVPGEAEEQQPRNKESAPARDRQRARAEARWMRLGLRSRWGPLERYGAGWRM